MTAAPGPFREAVEPGTAARARAVAERHEAAGRVRAMRTVAGRAHDPSDLLLLLSVLGLHPDDGQPHHS